MTLNIIEHAESIFGFLKKHEYSNEVNNRYLEHAITMITKIHYPQTITRAKKTYERLGWIKNKDGSGNVWIITYWENKDGLLNMEQRLRKMEEEKEKAEEEIKGYDEILKGD